MKSELLLVIALLVLSATTVAKDGGQEFGRLPRTHLFDDVGAPGEAVDMFLQRVGPKLRAYSDATGFEACGAVGYSSATGTYSVSVGTNKSHIACAVHFAAVLPSFEATGESIHSHGGTRSFRMNRADKTFMSVPSDARSAATAFVYGQNIDTFSERDKAGSAGYLATSTGIIYHDGNWNVTSLDQQP